MAETEPNSIYSPACASEIEHPSITIAPNSLEVGLSRLWHSVRNQNRSSFVLKTMKRSELKRGTSTLRRKGFKSAFVRHSPFSSQNGLKLNVAIQGGKEGENAPSTPVVSGNGNSRGLKTIGKKGREWIEARKWLKKQFGYKGLTHCMMRFQGCWFDVGGFAHPAKRRNLKEGELWLAVPTCNPCHSQLENMPPEKMRELVETAWAKSGIKLPQNS